MLTDSGHQMVSGDSQGLLTEVELSIVVTWGLVPGPPQIPKSLDSEVPYVKWLNIRM